MLTQVSFPAFLSLLHICPFCALRPHRYCHETAGPSLARTAAFSRTQNSGVVPRHRTNTAWGHRASGHRTGSSNRGRIDLVTCLEKFLLLPCAPGSAQAALPVPLYAGLCPRVPASSPAAPRLPKQSWSYNPPAPSEGEHSGVWERCCGAKSCVVVGRLPSIPSWEQLWPSQGRSATLQPAAGASGAAGSSCSGRRCWWPGPPGKH